MVRTGAITAAARAGAENSAWSAVHGLASLLVEGGLRLAASERERARSAVMRMLLIGLGVSPELAVPSLGPPADLRPARGPRRSPANP